MENTPTRRSGRARQPNKRYDVDPLEGLDILSSDSENGQSHDSDIESDEDAADEEFAITAVDSDHESDDQISAEAEDAEEAVTGDDASRNISAPIPVESRTPMEDADFSPGTKPPEKRKSEGRDNGLRPKKTQVRGIRIPISGSGKRTHIFHIFGKATEDILKLVTVRDKWFNDATLPSRRPDKDGVGGMDLSPFYPAELREEESSKGWEWYRLHGGREKFTANQSTSILTVSEVERYVKQPRISHSVLLGPVGNSKLIDLAYLESISVGTAFEGIEHNVPLSVKANSDQVNGPTRKSWLVNVGNRIEDLSWVPYDSGDLQFLSVVAGDSRPLAAGPPDTNISARPIAPAYTKSHGGPAAIQIWAFGVCENLENNDSCLDLERRPMLQYIICTEWGRLKHFKWCPSQMAQETPRPKPSDTIHLGLLAGVWDDGCLRVIDLSLPRPMSDLGTKYVRIDTVAFEASLPDTLCTCLEWLSSSDIAVGCANGFAAIWSIDPRSSSPKTSTRSGPLPWFYSPLHPTYIHHISSCYPSRPHLLVTASMDGYVRLTDLRSPNIDSVWSPRSRAPYTALVYCDHIQAILCADADNYLRLLPIRRFFSAGHVARTQGVVLTASVGRGHPIILMGSADGSATTTNPLRKLLYSKTSQYQQIWFRHEWSHLKRKEGLSRITEGYKVEAPSDTSHNPLPNAAEGSSWLTIFEEKSAVTKVAWNPDPRFGGLAASGMGSGLLRVEDLAI